MLREHCRGLIPHPLFLFRSHTRIDAIGNKEQAGLHIAHMLANGGKDGDKYSRRIKCLVFVVKGADDEVRTSEKRKQSVLGYIAWSVEKHKTLHLRGRIDKLTHRVGFGHVEILHAIRLILPAMGDRIFASLHKDRLLKVRIDDTDGSAFPGKIVGEEDAECALPYPTLLVGKDNLDIFFHIFLYYRAATKSRHRSLMISFLYVAAGLGPGAAYPISFH